MKTRIKNVKILKEMNEHFEDLYKAYILFADLHNAKFVKQGIALFLSFKQNNHSRIEFENDPTGIDVECLQVLIGIGEGRIDPAEYDDLPVFTHLNMYELIN